MNRPRVELPITTTDYILEGLSVLGVVLAIAFPLFAYDSLPDTIPTHLNGVGEVNGYGSKANLIAFPAIALFVYGLLTIVNNFPHHFNYSVKITPKNAKPLYSIATQLNRAMKAICCIFFALLSYEFVRLAKTGADESSMILLVLFLISIFGTIGYYWLKSNRAAEKY